jgi:hypothetical protein
MLNQSQQQLPAAAFQITWPVPSAGQTGGMHQVVPVDNQKDASSSHGCSDVWKIGIGRKQYVLHDAAAGLRITSGLRRLC